MPEVQKLVGSPDVVTLQTRSSRTPPSSYGSKSTACFQGCGLWRTNDSTWNIDDAQKQYTAQHKICLVCGSYLSSRMSLARIVHHSDASCLVHTRLRLNTIFNTTFPPFKVLPQNQSLVLPSHGDKPIPPNPQNAGLFGCLAMQSSLKSFEPNAIVQISSTENTAFHHQGGQVFAQ